MTGVPQVRCRAHAKSNGRKQCRNWAILGATVCRVHGGNAPQVRKKAEERIKEMVPMALDRYDKIIAEGSDSDARYVCKDILDRAGHKAVDQLEITGAGGGPLVDMSAIEGASDALLDQLGAIFGAAMAKLKPDDFEREADTDGLRSDSGRAGA